VAAVRIYTNENVNVAIAEGLRQRGVDAWSARDSGTLGLSDVEQLENAIAEKAAVFTHDADFLRLARKWASEGKEHPGIIFCHEQALGIGEAIRRLVDIALILDAEEMVNRVEYL